MKQLYITAAQKQALERITHKKSLILSRNIDPVTRQKLHDTLLLEELSQWGDAAAFHLRPAQLKRISEGIGMGGVPLALQADIARYYQTLQLVTTPKQKEIRHEVVTMQRITELAATILGKQNATLRMLLRTSNLTQSIPIRVVPPASSITHALRQILSDYRVRVARMHPIIAATYLHHAILQLAPFAEGNDRIARMLLYGALTQEGYPQSVLLFADRKRYIAALRKADAGNSAYLLTVLLQAVERSLSVYERATTQAGSEPQELHLPLSRLARRSTYSAKYLNLLVRSGRLEAYKRGRVWVSSAQAILRYEQSRLRKRNRTIPA